MKGCGIDEGTASFVICYDLCFARYKKRLALKVTDYMAALVANKALPAPGIDMVLFSALGQMFEQIRYKVRMQFQLSTLGQRENAIIDIDIVDAQ